MSIFVADLHDMFKSGVLDTKCLAEYLIREPATYLEYLFRKWYVGVLERAQYNLKFRYRCILHSTWFSCYNYDTSVECCARRIPGVVV